MKVVRFAKTSGGDPVASTIPNHEGTVQMGALSTCDCNADSVDDEQEAEESPLDQIDSDDDGESDCDDDDDDNDGVDDDADSDDDGEDGDDDADEAACVPSGSAAEIGGAAGAVCTGGADGEAESDEREEPCPPPCTSRGT